MQIIDSDYEYYYKYLPFNEGSLCVISDGTIKFTNPFEFNDPFDCQASFDSKYLDSATEFRERSEKWVKAGMLGRVPSTASRIIANQKIRNRLGSESYMRDLHRQTGIVSLSADPLSILMWSHYAQNHMGFIVEFRFQKQGYFSEELQAFMPLKIEYDKEFPIISKSDRDDHGLVKKGYLTKADSWSYEQEFRVVDQAREAGIRSYPRVEVLNSVIAGWKMSKEKRSQLVEVVRQASKDIGRNIQVFSARNIENEYALTVPKHPRLDVERLRKKLKVG